MTDKFYGSGIWDDGYHAKSKHPKSKKVASKGGKKAAAIKRANGKPTKSKSSDTSRAKPKKPNKAKTDNLFDTRSVGRVLFDENAPPVLNKFERWLDDSGYRLLDERWLDDNGYRLLDDNAPPRRSWLSRLFRWGLGIK